MVFPLFKSDAQSSATAAFFEVLTSIEPESSRPPYTRKLVFLFKFKDIISLESSSEIRVSISRVIFCLPLSMRLIALCEVPTFSASSDWVKF